MIKDVPLDINEGMLTRFRVRDPQTREFVSDAAIDHLVSAAAAMRANAETARSLAEAISADRSFSGQAGRQRFPADATKLFMKAENKITEAMKVAFTELARVEKSIRPGAPLNMLASEIRARLAALPSEQRSNILNEADDATIGAIISGPYWLSGLTKSQVDLAYRAWSEKRYPAENDRIRRIGKALDAARRVGLSFQSYVEDLTRTMTTPAVQAAAKVKVAQEAARAAAE